MRKVIYMLLAGWEVRRRKNCDRGHSFSLYGQTLRRPKTFLSFFFSCRKLAYKFFTSGFVYATLPLNRLTRRLQYKPFAKNLTSKRTNKSNTIRRKMYYFELLYVSAFSSLVKVSKTVFPVWNFVQSLKLYYKNSFVDHCETLDWIRLSTVNWVANSEEIR